jgi:hypothetical protein
LGADKRSVEGHGGLLGIDYNVALDIVGGKQQGSRLPNKISVT